ncbi:MAG: Hsp20/alpha crystallin family protein [Candidatus Rokubacteria bacterium]|nr:Hsp20/alpha crystallin family protein [Candidatus Rokubacteria bacterium]
MEMRALVPFSGFPSLRKEMERFFDRFGDWEFPELRPFGDWAPSLDVSETKEAFVVKAEIPGIEPKEIQVSLDNQMLTLKGEKKHEKEEKEEQFYRMERAYGAFARSVRLPAPVDGSKVTAAFKNGLLTVTLPKAPGAKGMFIPVKAE